MWRGQLGVIPI